MSDRQSLSPPHQRWWAKALPPESLELNKHSGEKVKHFQGKPEDNKSICTQRSNLGFLLLILPCMSIVFKHIEIYGDL